MIDGHATWVYAVTSGDVSGETEWVGMVPGVAGQPVRIVNRAGLAAVVSSVDAAFVSEGVLQQRLADASELEAMARAHHAVVNQIAARQQVLPLRLATVYRDDDRVRELLSERQDEFARVLRWLQGRTECGVKVWADSGCAKHNGVHAAVAAAGASREPTSPEVAGPEASRDDAPGTAYLLRRKASLNAREDSWQRAVTGTEQIHDSLAGLAVAAQRHAPQDARLADEDGWMVLNGAYLIEADSFARFETAAKAIVAGFEGFWLEVTGPWPPYSFAGGPPS